MFRGRELSHPELGREILQRVAAQLKDLVSIERDAKLEGKNMIMILAPKAQIKGGKQYAVNIFFLRYVHQDVFSKERTQPTTFSCHIR